MKLTLLTSMLIFTASQLIAQELAFNWTSQSIGKTTTGGLISSNTVSFTKQEFVRPFITDDSRVVGDRLAQLESWVRFDKEAGQHWILGAYGPNKKLELTLGGVYGYQVENESKKTMSYALPLLQAKFLFKEYQPNKAPGVGMVVGTFLPVGQGTFKPAGYGTFGFLTISQCLGEGEKFLFHGNFGGNYLHVDGSNNLISTWGLGTQIKAYKGIHLVAEVFSGDPYIPGTGTSW
jgi:hypothetical protein